MKSVSLTGLFLLSLSSGLLLADKATDERLANAAKASRPLRADGGASRAAR